MLPIIIYFSLQLIEIEMLSMYFIGIQTVYWISIFALPIIVAAVFSVVFVFIFYTNKSNCMELAITGNTHVGRRKKIYSYLSGEKSHL